jgi:hypothetical protein
LQGHRHFTSVLNNGAPGNFGDSLLLGNRQHDQDNNIYTVLGVAEVSSPDFGWRKARVQKSTHGKQKGVKYIVKVL